MGKLIEEAAALAALDHTQYWQAEDKFRAKQAVQACPSVDAVPVIRCRDCRYWAVSSCDPESHFCKRIDPEDGPEGIDFLECDFCSMAKRKEENHGRAD